MAQKAVNPEAQVKSWGFSHVFTWTDGPDSHYSPHAHAGRTTHLILKGSLKMKYPEEKDAAITELGVGARWDVDAGKVHEVWIGPEGCTYVIGE